MELPLQRPGRAGASLNALELDLWNENADTIARVWEMPEQVSRIVRGSYLEHARRYFLEGKERTTVLELGCGSGWVGQSLASPALSVIGMDFSAAQIERARMRAKKKGLEAYCRYVLNSVAKVGGHSPRADAALLHAYLHHLDEEEIETVLAELRTSLAPGARIWIYEPAFCTHAATTSRAGLSTRMAFQLANLGSRLVRAAGKLSGLRNAAVADRFDALTQLAHRNGWYLSPKEVPLDDSVFTAQLAQKFRVKNSYWATLYLVGWAYECALLEASLLRSLACFCYLRPARAAERLALGDRAAVQVAARPPSHAFKVWECEVP